MTDNVTKHCETCGSADIVFDANAVWDTATQSFVYKETITTDEAYCNICGDTVFIEERPIAETLHTPEPEVHNPGASPQDYIVCTYGNKTCYSAKCNRDNRCTLATGSLI